jgi:lipopolysaccharide/colanic/teichoic acid biosynthesis glycosyltransferase
MTPLPPASAAPPVSRRADVIRELHRRYAGGAGGLRRRYLWKRWSWLAVTAGSRALKRGLDIAGALLGLGLSAPVLAAAAAAVRLHDGGPALFWQQRVGRHGREFPLPKLRTMVAGAESLRPALEGRNELAGGVTFKMRRDPRVTPVGRVLRKLSLDELPQLWCVLGGQMSLVGPRPPLPAEVARYTLADRRRLDVKPGLTCFWQVQGRGERPFAEQVKLDMDYIESQSLWLDLRLLLRTVPAVLLGRGAY